VDFATKTFKRIKISKFRKAPNVGPLINRRILMYSSVLVIDETGNSLGELKSYEALKIAKEKTLDILVVNPNTTPPVCKIVDYGKLKYEEAKQAKTNKKVKDLKQIKISPRISEHDLITQANKINNFLKLGHKIEIICVFKYRELSHPEIGRGKLEFLKQNLENYNIEKDITMGEKTMVFLVGPK
jgi:translation initiation factor IF-3